MTFTSTEMGFKLIFLCKKGKNTYQDKKMRYTNFISALNKIVEYDISRGDINAE
jgi:hypothetical protein